MPEVTIVTRSFQRGARFDVGFDQQRFDRGLRQPLTDVLKSSRVTSLIVVTCGGGDGGKYCEQVIDGETPTSKSLRVAFPSEFNSGRIQTVLCDHWGKNAGSTAALNVGFEAAKNTGAEFLMNWSPELRVKAEHIELALAHVERHELDVCGFLRSLHWLKPQWEVPQNTGAVWRVAKLASVDGFSLECDGDGVTTVPTERGPVPLLGMEDFECILRMHKKFGEGPRLGMVCRSHPLVWDVALKKPGSPEYEDHMNKIARQWGVMKAYALRHFPDEQFESVFMRIMGEMHFD